MPAASGALRGAGRFRQTAGRAASRRAYIVDTAPRPRLHCWLHMPAPPLGEFEVLVLLAVLHLADEAYPAAVRAEIERRARRTVARGAVYVTLDRLEAKRLLAS